ncbi:hypothetical protein [Spirochaeta africana]|uniref:DUF1566 domain-containing protein n=1 Tax=Spirochaeta africana (strain ATCC 700263 / DSM 8902 / Z-7692) TaxID=889378 RepID=H9UH40_SPIAZ|nr:hypothetical protein [Spirochaeta africana]AFG36833.1 hypothetical protein Spiaf_0736 [Spirochaeta africana DSM 8902]
MKNKKIIVVFIAIAAALVMAGCSNMIMDLTGGEGAGGEGAGGESYQLGDFAIGDTGPAGGLIFYIDEAEAFDWTFLEAAPNTWNGGTADPSIVWSDPSDTTGATGTEVGAGQANTTAIVTWLDDNDQEDRAAQVVDSLVFGGKEDWFLPSLDEVTKMYENLASEDAGGFTSAGYWSSSEQTANNARFQWFSSPFDATSIAKNNEFRRVRPIRAF